MTPAQVVRTVTAWQKGIACNHKPPQYQVSEQKHNYSDAGRQRLSPAPGKKVYPTTTGRLGSGYAGIKWSTPTTVARHYVRHQEKGLPCSQVLPRNRVREGQHVYPDASRKRLILELGKKSTLQPWAALKPGTKSRAREKVYSDTMGRFGTEKVSVNWSTPTPVANVKVRRRARTLPCSHGPPWKQVSRRLQVYPNAGRQRLSSTMVKISTLQLWATSVPGRNWSTPMLNSRDLRLGQGKRSNLKPQAASVPSKRASKGLARCRSPENKCRTGQKVYPAATGILGTRHEPPRNWVSEWQQVFLVASRQRLSPVMGKIATLQPRATSVRGKQVEIGPPRCRTPETKSGARKKVYPSATDCFETGHWPPRYRVSERQKVYPDAGRQRLIPALGKKPFLQPQASSKPGKKLFSDWFIVVRNTGPGFLGLFGRGDLDKSRISDHDKPIREKLLAYPWVKALLRVRVNGKSKFDMTPQRRLAYEADFKLKAINHAKQHGNRAAAREFNINESMVSKWRKQEDDLRLAKKTKKSFHEHKARWPQLEDRLE
ncbi:hypothetical protein TURU_071784 [Turdus rufiventris]|nr:hypothetical protein TURU_071784 [Turdus rufiventris]